MLVRMWAEGKPYVLVVEIETSSATMVINVEVLHSSGVLWLSVQVSLSLVHNVYSSVIYVSRIWHMLRYPTTEECTKKEWGIYTLGIFTAIKQ